MRRGARRLCGAHARGGRARAALARWAVRRSGAGTAARVKRKRRVRSMLAGVRGELLRVTSNRQGCAGIVIESACWSVGIERRAGCGVAAGIEAEIGVVSCGSGEIGAEISEHALLVWLSIRW